MLKAENIPVIAAIGEFTYRPQALESALEPIELMAEAMRATERDCDASILSQLDTVHLLGVVSWLYSNPAKLLCEKLSIAPAYPINEGMGGEKPVRLVHEAALAIQRGEKQAIAIVGGEAQNSFRKARRGKLRLDWTERASREEAWGHLEDTTLGISKEVQALGVQRPLHVYPFFENAFNHHQKKSPTESMQDSAQIWSGYSKVGSDNPYSWNPTNYTSKDIATIDEINRMVSFPYSKFMVANDSVKQAATLIVTSLAKSRELGIDESKLIYFRGGASAKEPTDFFERASFDKYPAMSAVLKTACELVDGGQNLDFMELYSCFPIVPKAALQVLKKSGVKDDVLPTVTGGLTFFGGPMNNYMTHAACAMVRALRGVSDSTGLLYGQGGAMTKHHALLLSKQSPKSSLIEDYSVQNHVDALQTKAPSIAFDYEGAAVIETYSAYYNSQNEPTLGIVIARTPENQRLIARVPPEDAESLLALTEFEINAVGTIGDIKKNAVGSLSWSI